MRRAEEAEVDDDCGCLKEERRVNPWNAVCGTGVCVARIVLEARQ